MTMTDAATPRGLKGVIVADTALGDVRGLEGFYHYRQYSAPELAAKRTFEDVWYLLFEGELPSLARRDEYTARIAAARHLPAVVLDLLPAMVGAGTPPLAALRTALSHLAAVEAMPPTYDADPQTIRANALRLCAVTPVLVAALYRASIGAAAIAPRDDLGSAANYLYMIDGEVPEPARARAIEQYLILAIDHGFNASTFTARVVTSTGADVGAAVVAALGALSGPLHGGAPSRALDTLDA
ncbi:MAG TPA: citrate/2-methylcitrate synthase, partial [Acidimicrobiia bacterium]|nr:citrate/2-methylcitrate synthase [Acidimicrobiia bacterium]